MLRTSTVVARQLALSEVMLDMKRQAEAGREVISIKGLLLSALSKLVSQLHLDAYCS